MNRIVAIFLERLLADPSRLRNLIEAAVSWLHDRLTAETE